jgi:hypothetical protein
MLCMFLCSEITQLSSWIKKTKKTHKGGTPFVGALGGLYFITATSRTPSFRKLGQKSRGSTGPGNLKEMVNGPGGQSCWTLIWKTLDESFSIPASTVTTPFMWTVPLCWISHFKLPGKKKVEYVISYITKQHATAIPQSFGLRI